MNLRSFWDNIGIIVGIILRGHCGIIVGSLGIILGSCWDGFGLSSGRFGDDSGTISGSFWDHFGIVLR